MTSKILQELLKSTAFLGVLLLIGLYLRAKISYSDVSVPASVIGGFLGLLQGLKSLVLQAIPPYPLNGTRPVPRLQGFSSFPCLPDSLGKLRQENGSTKKTAKKPLRFAIVSGIKRSLCQDYPRRRLPYFLWPLFPVQEFYNQFGYEICQGFNGGHGMAGAIGSLLMEGGASY